MFHVLQNRGKKKKKSPGLEIRRLGLPSEEWKVKEAGQVDRGSKTVSPSRSVPGPITMIVIPTLVLPPLLLHGNDSE